MMIIEWVKKHLTLIIGGLVCVGFLFYCYSCEPKVPSMMNRGQFINRQELQLELDQFIQLSLQAMKGIAEELGL